MQRIADSFQNSGGIYRKHSGFSEAASAISGALISVEGSQVGDQSPPEALQSSDSKSDQPVSPPQEAEIQDESPERFYFRRCLEYIEEIEVNILNLEQEPGNKGLYQYHIPSISFDEGI